MDEEEVMSQKEYLDCIEGIYLKETDKVIAEEVLKNANIYLKKGGDL